MVKEQKMYLCEICDQSFAVLQNAKACEESHAEEQVLITKCYVMGEDANELFVPNYRNQSTIYGYKIDFEGEIHNDFRGVIKFKNMDVATEEFIDIKLREAKKFADWKAEVLLDSLYDEIDTVKEAIKSLEG